MARIIFVRHGDPNYVDDCLTPKGREQAQRTSLRLKNESISGIYSSPCGRALETAGYTARDKGLEITELDFMREIGWRNDSEDPVIREGHPWTLAYKLLSEGDTLTGGMNWRESKYFKGNLCVEQYNNISEKTDEFLATQGIKRKGSSYVCTEVNNNTIAVFSHGGSGACALSHILNLPFPYMLITLPYGVCSITILAFDAEHEGDVIIPRIELFNDCGHVSGAAREKLHFEN